MGYPGPHLVHCSLDPIVVHIPYGISISLFTFARFTLVLSSHTDTPRYTCSNRPHCYTGLLFLSKTNCKPLVELLMLTEGNAVMAYGELACGVDRAVAGAAGEVRLDARPQHRPEYQVQADPQGVPDRDPDGRRHLREEQARPTDVKQDQIFKIEIKTVRPTAQPNPRD